MRKRMTKKSRRARLQEGKEAVASILNSARTRLGQLALAALYTSSNFIVMQVSVIA